MPAGNISERQIDLRSDSTSNYSTLKDYFDSVQILQTEANKAISVSAGFATIDSVELTNVAGIVPLASGAISTITSTGNVGLNGGLVATKIAALAASTVVSSNVLGVVLNRVEVRDPVSKDPILVPNGASQGAMIYGLLHCLTATNPGDAIGADTEENLSISLAYTNASGVVTLISYTGAIEYNLNLVYQRRHTPRVVMGGGATPRQDEIGGTIIEEGSFTATVAFASGEVLDLTTGGGNGSTPGSSTRVIQPTGEDIALPTDFNTNPNCTAELNGIRLVKGTQVSYLSADELTLNITLDVGDTITLRVPKN